MGSSYADFLFDEAIDEFCDQAEVGEERGVFYRMNCIPPDKDERILIWERDFEPTVSSFIDEVSEERWPIDGRKGGYWMRLPEDPREN